MTNGDPDQTAPTELRAPFRVHSYEVGPEGQLRPRALCNYLQEVAGTHARLLGVSMERLADEGLAWVLRRLHLRQEAAIARGSSLEVQTWPSGFHRIVAHRHFVVRNEQGDEVAHSVSEWVMVDLNLRRVARIPEWVQEVRVGQHGSALEFEGRTLLRVDPVEPGAVTSVELRVPHAAIDVLGHVTNSQYVEWLKEPMSESFVSSHRPVEIDIQFMRESLRGERLRSAVWREDPGEESLRYFHRIDGPEGDERARARTIWRPR